MSAFDKFAVIHPARQLAQNLPFAVRDRLIGVASIADLATGATVATSSPRRTAQQLHLRPDLTVVPFRGNVAARLAKLVACDADAILLAGDLIERTSPSLCALFAS